MLFRSNLTLAETKADLEAQAAGPATALREELARAQATVAQLTEENAHLKTRLGAAGAVTATLVTKAGGGNYTPLEDRSGVKDGYFLPNEYYRNTEATWSAYARADFGIDYGAKYGFKQDVNLAIQVEAVKAD